MKVYINGRVFDGEKILENKIVLVEKDKIIAVTEKKNLPRDCEKIDLQGHLLAPSFIDLQIYGGNGFFFGEFPSVKALEATYAYCLAGGAAHFMPTVATHSEKIREDAIEVVRAYWAKGGKGVLGLHLEGPYINAAKRGAHLMEHIKNNPTIQDIKKWLTLGKGIVKIMTLAPEVCSTEIINFLQTNGVLVSAGHSNATFNEATTAFNNGIPLATHLFNAMSPLQHREVGMVGAIFEHPKVNVSLVADGYHVDFNAIRIAKKILGARLFLITDAVTENIQPQKNSEGVLTMPQYTHQLQGEKYVIADGTLSGSALTMAHAVKNCVEKAHIPLEEALRMASLYPAKIMGLDKQLGRIKKGFAADFVIMDNELSVISRQLLAPLTH